MASIVGGFLMPHLPTIPSGALITDSKTTEQLYATFDRIADRLVELDADTVIIIGDDHYENFGPTCIPTCLIVTGEIDVSPHVELLGMAKGRIANNEPLASHILQTGFAEGIDWAFSKFLGVDHSIAVPYTMSVKKHPNIRIVPVLLNDVVAPLIPSARAKTIGESIARAVASWDGDERVVIFGTGGISHWVGGPGMGNVNEEFDRRILDMVAAGDLDGLVALSDDVVLEEAGNGALEIKNWICALAALPGHKAEVLAYDAIPEWVTGCGFAELKVAA